MCKRVSAYRGFYCELLLGVVATALVANSLTPAGAEDWPQWRGKDRANRSSETGLFKNWGENGPKLDWIVEGVGSGYASVSVVEGTIYTTGNFDDGQAVVALAAEDGSIVWKKSITDQPPKHGYDGSRCTPTVDGQRLYVVSSDGRIVCLNRNDGDIVWERNFSDWNGKMMSGWGYSESPLVDGDLVICTPGGDKGEMVALNKDSGDDVWAAKLPPKDSFGSNLNDGAGYSSPVISTGGGVKQYVQLTGRGVFGVRAKDGEFLWGYDRVGNTTANIPTPLVVGDHIFTSTGYNTGSALLKLTKAGPGKVTAEEVYWLDGNQLQNKHGGMVLVGSHIYCGQGNGNGLPICVNVKDGEIAWGPERGHGDGESSVTYADGHVIFRRKDGTVALVKATPEEFVVVASFKPEFQKGDTWAQPVNANGKMYLREQEKLMCYDVK